MSTLKQILAEHGKLVAEAQETLGRERAKSPTLQDASLAAKQTALQTLRKRATHLVAAKAKTLQRFDMQLAVYEQEIAALERQLEQDRSRAAAPQPSAKAPASKRPKK